MANPISQPWAILLCRFKDDPDDPAQTRLSDLYSQWINSFGPTWVADNLTADAQTDSRTILDLYLSFFTTAGAGTFNSVKYWDEMSHGSIDVSGTRVFPIKLDMTKAEGASQALSPGGSRYQNDIFHKAKDALSVEHGVDWKTFYGVAVSFQSPDYGAQGGWFDDGPGVYMDIRWVRNQGMAAWGQEMGHAFGLDHSRQEGSNSDYQDMWDAMSTMNAFCYSPDANYGLVGIGCNSWNMRSRQWLNETRVWKAPPTNDFSTSIALRPLHRRDLEGYLAAELPGIGGSSAYLIEFRAQRDWDSDIPANAVLVHRFEGAIGQFLGTHTYLEKGTNGQFALLSGDVFESGTGPFSRVRVASIDPTNLAATVQLCYSSRAKVKPSLKIVVPNYRDTCFDVPVEGSSYRFRFRLSSTFCLSHYTIRWGVSGASPIQGERNDGKTFSVILPDPSTLVTVSVTMIFDDGSTISDSYSFHPISEAEANLILFICRLRQERLKPIPWWEWDPEKIRVLLRDYSPMELRLIESRLEKIVNTVRRVAELTK